MPTWIAAGNGTWTNAANWSGGVPDSIGAIANIGISQNGGTVQIGIPENDEIIVGAINITTTGTSGLTIRGSAVDTGTGVGTLVFNDDNDDFALLEVTTTLGGGPAVFSSAFGLNMRLDDHLVVLTYTAGTVARFDLDISGSRRIQKEGAGVLELNGTNSFTGGLSLLGGVLDAAGDASIGPGAVAIANNATFRSVGTIDNQFRTASSDVGNVGSARIVAATGNIMTMTGVLDHLSQGTFSFGSVTDTGTIVASFSAINYLGGSGINIAGGTLRLGTAYVAANLFNQSDVSTFVDGGFGGAPVLDTGGFATITRDFTIREATIRASSGTLNITVNGTFSQPANGGGGFNATIEGTAGVDQLIINTPSDAFLRHVTFTNWTNGVDSIQINGSSADNTLRGSQQRDTINGFDGADFIGGYGGIDTIQGGNGNDVILLTAPNPTFGSNSGSFVDGGSGVDKLMVAYSGTLTLGSLSGIEAVDIESGAILQLTGTQFATGLAANSVLSGTGRIIVDLELGAQPLLFKLMTEEVGSDVQFTINGTSGADIIKANDFTINTLNGGAGTDLLNGGNSGDFINGGNDADKIRGSGGVDVLTGGAGADIFKYRAFSDAGTGIQADIINDFVSGEDKINFRRLDADPGTAGHQSFAFIGSAAFAANGSAQIRYVDTGNDLRVDVDANGDGVADMSIALLGAGAGAGLLFASDFLL
jgi:autotransporter-associated beta strand protein